MIHAVKTVTVGDLESIIDSPIVLYRGDREVEIQFTILEQSYTFNDDNNLIKSSNASHGQLVLNTPSGENMFSEISKCHDGNVVFVVTKDMIDELKEVGFYSFQIRLYDSSQTSRITIPPVFNGFDIRNPIAAEDEGNIVDQAVVDYSRIHKDLPDEELPVFDWEGNYNKTDWSHHDVITENKLDKIENALYSINVNVSNSNTEIRNTLDNVKTDINADIDELERNINAGVEQFKIDTNAAMTAYKNEVSEEFEKFNDAMIAYKNEVNNTFTTIRNEVDEFTNQFDTSHISKYGYYTAPGGLLLQWGTLSIYFDGVASHIGEYDFNIPFKNEVFALFVDTNVFGPDANEVASSFDMYPTAYSHRLDKFRCEVRTISGKAPTGTVYFSWFAIGI